MSRGLLLGGLAVAWLAACGSSDNDASGTGGSGGTTQASGDVVVFGRVTVDEKGSQAAVAGGATVKITGDFDGDGAVSASEVVTATADDKGEYRPRYRSRRAPHCRSRPRGRDIWRVTSA